VKKILPILALALMLQSCFTDKPRILVFSKTKGFRHESIKAGKDAIQKLGSENGFEVDTTENSAYFNEDSLKNYRAVVFLSTTGDVLDFQQQNAFKRFIQAGGGYVGIHAAADTEYDWWWYGKMVGAYFKSHPQQQKAKLIKVKTDKLDQKTPEPWDRFDEWYNYKNISDKINVLYKLDESSYQGGENGTDHPIVWYHEFDGGRVFYTGMGHTNESFQEKEFVDQMLMGIKYAMGDRKPDFSKAREQKLPEDNRFKKVVLGYNLDEPTEFTILPDGRIIFIERKGAVKLYDPKTDSITQINKFNVYTTHEDGMIGITKDPDFANNQWLYVFYSHPERSANVVARFTFKDNAIDMSSEKQILDVATQRQTCCHTGGSLAFGPDGNLYISTGDNTSPFESDGYSPADESPNRSPFDAQKSSANTNDLRGKILRIRPTAEGGYTIPEGNLFGKGEEKTRPEVYVMGTRNPYRISLDEKTGFLYWGEVGPDAGSDHPERGPRGYDEVNQARKPGYFGWPLFVGNNYAYGKYDFAKKTVGNKHDPAKPMNTSPNNTGKTELPPANPAFIWYPYAASPDFPLMKEGGRNAMAGPVFYSEKYKGQANPFPEYIDGKLIIYDWMRNWVRLVSMDAEGNITDIEPFLSGMQFNNIIDMEFGPDGKLYTLEYGTAWFKQNMDARLSRIEYNKDNRGPDAKLTADVTKGAVPLSVTFSAAESTDPDGDAISFELEINGTVLKSDNGNFRQVFDKPGIYKPTLTVTDAKGYQSSTELTIIAGNQPPEVAIAWTGNSQFYLDGTSGTYTVSVSDKEDGTLADGKIKPERVIVSFNYLPQGYDLTKVSQGHQKAELPGKILIAESDCKSCHMIDEKSAGPSYRDIAQKYKKDPGALDLLANKIINGGSGVWGEVAMAAHPQITKEQAVQMVEYIISLAKEAGAKSLGVTGSVSFNPPPPPPNESPKGAYLLTASYDDRGNGAIPSLSGEKTLVLRAPYVAGGEATSLNGPRKFNTPNGQQILEGVTNGGSATFQALDLTGVNKLEFVIAEVAMMTKGGTIDVFLDKADGTKLGTVDFKNSPEINVMTGVNMKAAALTSKTSGVHDLVLVFKNPDAGDSNLFYFAGFNLKK
jgi:cytochrome c